MKRVRVCSLAAAIALASTACGAETVPADDASSAPGEATVKSARFETVTRIEDPGQLHAPELRSTGFVDYTRNRSEHRDVATGCRTIAIGDVTYSEFPPLDGVPRDKRWVQVDGATTEQLVEAGEESEQLAEPAADDEQPTVTLHVMEAGYLAVSASVTPGESVEHLRKVAGELERVGDEELRGVCTTRFRARADAREWARADVEAASWKPANVERYLESVGDGRITVDVWVDGSGRVHRSVTRYTYDGVAESDGAFTTVATTDFFDHGVVAEIEPPPHDAVLEWDAWARGVHAHMDELSPTEWTEGIESFPVQPEANCRS